MRSLAAEFTLSHRPRQGARAFFARIDENTARLREAYRLLADDVHRGESTVPATEWLLDNFPLIESAARETRRNLPRRWFINVAGAGYDAYVTERVPRPVPSAFTYLRIALRGLAEYRAPRFSITTADGAHIAGPMLLAFVANAQYCGNRMQVAPTARMDDGMLDVLAVRELSLLQALPKLAKLYGGRILGDPAVQHLRAARVRIETDPPAVIQADGQIIGKTPAEFSLRPQALTVATGPAGPSPAGAAARVGSAPRSG